MNKMWRQLASIILILVVFSLVFNFLEKALVEKKEISLSEAIQLIRDKEVSKITVAADKVELASDNNQIYFAKIETNSSFIETLKNFGFSPEEIQALNIKILEQSGWSYWLGILLPFILPVILLGVLFYYSFRRTNQSAMQIFSFSRSNIKLFSPDKDRITFKDVAGLKEAKEELQEIVEFLKNPKKFQELGARIPRGVLLMGAPGSGKTLLARAVAGEANVPFFHISGSEFVEMFVGVGAGRVRDAFNTVKKAAPAILFIDEIDAIGRERGAGIGGGQDEREQTLNQILVEMDGFDRDTRVIVMAATNRPDILDFALLRPGRFDRRVVLDLPDINGREEILKIHTRDKILGPDVNLRDIAERTPGFSGADLANLVNEAAILAARKNKKAIEQQDMLSSIEKVMLGPERKSRVFTDKEKKITAYHEAGHALVSLFLPGASELKKVSIISRGQAAGYTMKMPTEERYLKTRSEFLADIAALLAGYITESLVFHDISTGAANDLETATDLARSLVTKYGMSEKLGPRSFGKTEEMIFLGKEISTEKDYSEETATLIDKEINKIIQDCYKKAKQILEENRKKLDKLAQALIEKETLERMEIEQLIK
ncbi:MAG: ATP-dependent metallopeptidase FtsH/Yme1/Tma family protein [Parcubacteria group bacterium]|nr:ATP-dependent metallopeptidase FtsH/Yme1/Tma family protein [Parcubacteria group bacterium]